MNIDTLADLGWSAHFLSQLELSELGHVPLRIAEVHRSRLVGLGEAGARELAPFAVPVTVGDWVLADAARVVRLLERRSCLTRRAAGTGAEVQLIAANVDTLMVVTSCNADFNEARLERYLALAAEAGCAPVVVLTRADLAAPEPYVARAERLKRGLAVVAVDATRLQPGRLADWCRAGQTVALAGSSGTGKTTLTNALTGAAAATAEIRADDAKGRHTTTARALRPMAGGGWIIDTPGMRALRLADAGRGIDAVFDDVTALAAGCRFRDCAHEAEPGCAVRAAIEAGDLAGERLERWRKLRREDRRNSETLAEARARDREFGRMVRGVMREKGRRER